MQTSQVFYSRAAKIFFSTLFSNQMCKQDSFQPSQIFTPQVPNEPDFNSLPLQKFGLYLLSSLDSVASNILVTSHLFCISQ